MSSRAADRATIDQICARARDLYDHFEVDAEHPIARVGILVTWMLFSENIDRPELALLAIAEHLGLD